jgi:hypothetical protein
VWFWTEVVAASWGACWRAAPTYSRSMLTGALLGLTAAWLSITLTSQLLLRLGWLAHAAEWQGQHYAVLLVSGFVCTAAAGWVVARLHRSHSIAAVVGFSAAVMTWPLWKLPFLARLYPEVFSASVQPHLTFLILGLVFVAPLSIVVGARVETAFR